MSTPSRHSIVGSASAGWTTGRATLFVFAFAVLTAPTACRASSEPPVRPLSSWWFPSEIPAGKRFEFHVAFDLSLSSRAALGGAKSRTHEELDITITTSAPPPGRSGVTVCLEMPRLTSESTGPISAIAAGLAGA